MAVAVISRHFAIRNDFFAKGKSGLRQIVLLLGLLVAFSSASVTKAGVLYVLSGTTSRPNFPSFGTIDVTTGAYTEIQSQLAVQRLRSLSWNPSISAFYTIDGDADNTPVLLSTIDTNGTVSTSASPMGSRFVEGMAYRPSDSTIYAYDSDGSDYGTIDTGTGAWTNLIASGHGITDSGANGRFTIHQDTLYLTGDNGVQGVFGSMGYTPASTFTQIGGFSDFFVRMSLASDGTTLYGVFGNGAAGSQSLYSINPATGALSFISAITGSGLGTRFYGAAFQPSSQPVPEPSTIVISLAGLAYAGFAKRRQLMNANA